MFWEFKATELGISTMANEQSSADDGQGGKQAAGGVIGSANCS